MSMSLYDSVVNESFGYEFGDQTRLDPTVEAEINERVNDDNSMMQYTGECLLGMMAMEAAIAKMDGIMAVKAMQAKSVGDSVTLEQLDATMEGFAANAWETLKEWIKKAYTAIKTFLIKQWNKLKGAANVVKAFFGKYGDMLRSKDCSGCEVNWMEINPEKAFDVFNKYKGEIDKAITKLNTEMKSWETNYDTALGSGTEAERDAAKKNSFDAKYAANDNVSGRNSKGQMMKGARNLIDEVFASIPKIQDIHRDLLSEVYPGNEQIEKKKFTNDVKTAAIEAADINGYKKYIDFFIKMGDKSHSEAESEINKAKSIFGKGESGHKAKGLSVAHSAMRRLFNTQLEIHRICMSTLKDAISKKHKMALAACRKAIMWHSTKGAGATKAEESWNPSVTESSNGLNDLIALYM